MKEHPILFSGPMVKAILDGKKTQTRRVVKPQPHESAGLGFLIPMPNNTSSVAQFQHVDDRGIHSHELTVRCPYGMPGDRLWVRETFCVHEDCRSYGARTVYRADVPDPEEWEWTPSIHMPRWASRITLEITEVRVQRLNEISEEDAIAEGIIRDEAWKDGYEMVWHCGDFKMHYSAKEAFKTLWESINGKDTFDSRWVWAITFKPLDAPAAGGL